MGCYFLTSQLAMSRILINGTFHWPSNVVSLHSFNGLLKNMCIFEGFSFSSSLGRQFSQKSR